MTEMKVRTRARVKIVMKVITIAEPLLLAVVAEIALENHVQFDDLQRATRVNQKARTSIRSNKDLQYVVEDVELLHAGIGLEEHPSSNRPAHSLGPMGDRIDNSK